MNTEHNNRKPQDTELPRFIEKKPTKLSGIARLHATYTPQEW